MFNLTFKTKKINGYVLHRPKLYSSNFFDAFVREDGEIIFTGKDQKNKEAIILFKTGLFPMEAGEPTPLYSLSSVKIDGNLIEKEDIPPQLLEEINAVCKSLSYDSNPYSYVYYFADKKDLIYEYEEMGYEIMMIEGDAEGSTDESCQRLSPPPLLSSIRIGKKSNRQVIDFIRNAISRIVILQSEFNNDGICFDFLKSITLFTKDSTKLFNDSEDFLLPQQEKLIDGSHEVIFGIKSENIMITADRHYNPKNTDTVECTVIRDLDTSYF